MAGILLDIPPVVEEAKDFVNGLDTLWVLLGAMLVFWMQPGFALVEAGLTRAKNTANIFTSLAINIDGSIILIIITSIYL